MRDEQLDGRSHRRKTGPDTFTFEGCKLAAHECASNQQAPGTIETGQLESFIEDEESNTAADTEFFQDPVMTFTCGTKATRSRVGSVEKREAPTR